MALLKRVWHDFLYLGMAQWGMALLRRLWHDYCIMARLSGYGIAQTSMARFIESQHGSVRYGIIQKGVARIIVSRYGSLWHDLLYQGVA
jgi:hypothetical protein